MLTERDLHREFKRDTGIGDVIAVFYDNTDKIYNSNYVKYLENRLLELLK